MRQMKVQHTEISEEQKRYDMVHNLEAAVEAASLCRFFVNGLCNRGSQCLYSHSLQAKRPLCKFFFTLQVHSSSLKYFAFLFSSENEKACS